MTACTEGCSRPICLTMDDGNSRLRIESALARLLLLLSCLRVVSLQDAGVKLGLAARTNNQAQVTLSCESGVSYVIESSPDLQAWTPVVTNSDASIARVFAIDAPGGSTFYRARRGYLPLFASALATSQGIDFKGNNVASDSFDSADAA